MIHQYLEERVQGRDVSIALRDHHGCGRSVFADNGRSLYFIVSEPHVRNTSLSLIVRYKEYIRSMPPNPNEGEVCATSRPLFQALLELAQTVDGSNTRHIRQYAEDPNPLETHRTRPDSAARDRNNSDNICIEVKLPTGAPTCCR